MVRIDALPLYSSAGSPSVRPHVFEPVKKGNGFWPKSRPDEVVNWVRTRSWPQLMSKNFNSILHSRGSWPRTAAHGPQLQVMGCSCNSWELTEDRQEPLKESDLPPFVAA